MSDSVAEAAALLLAARREPSRKLADLPEPLKPADRAAAYAIQRKVAEATGPIGGWKVSPFGTDAPPMCGALPASGIVAGPATLRPGPFALRGIEAEVSVRIGHDLPPRATHYTREEVIAAIAALHPAIEVLDSRFVEPGKVAQSTGIADTQGHGGFVYGAGVTDWHGIDLATETMQQFVDGVLDASRTGQPGGDLIGEVVWLANVGSVWAGGLKAGQFVTCGSWSGANRVGPTAKVLVKFAHVGDVALEFAA
jgi:2-keto-4-pentenoate hydratase